MNSNNATTAGTAGTVVQISGTINSVGSKEKLSGDRYIQRLILINVSSGTRHYQVNNTVAAVLEFDTSISIPFVIGSPITCRGKYQPASLSRLPTLSNVYKPLGFVRYQGVIYS